jgi:aspartyl aminopeptidase
MQVHCFTGLQALIAHSKEPLASDVDVSVLVTFDHEEVGSGSTHGAGSLRPHALAAQGLMH